MVVFLFSHSIIVLGLIVFVSQVNAVPLAVSFFILDMYVLFGSCEQQTNHTWYVLEHRFHFEILRPSFVCFV